MEGYRMRPRAAFNFLESRDHPVSFERLVGSELKEHFGTRNKWKS